MAIKELDIDGPKYISLKRSTFYGLIAVIIIIIFLFGIGGLIGYSIATTPKTMCSLVINHHLGDQDAQDGCYYKLAKEYNELEYCNGIKNKDLQKECARILTEIMQAY